MCWRGTDSSHTGCQMPVVRWYQMACGFSRQSCLPRGWLRVERVVFGAHDDDALASRAWRHVEAEGGLTALVRPDVGSVDPDVGAVSTAPKCTSVVTVSCLGRPRPAAE